MKDAVFTLNISKAPGGELWLDSSNLTVPRLMPNMAMALRAAHSEIAHVEAMSGADKYANPETTP